MGKLRETGQGWGDRGSHALVTVKHESIRVFSGRTDRAHVVTFGSGCIRSQTTYLSYLLTNNVVTFGSGYRWEKCDFWEWVSVTFGSG